MKHRIITALFGLAALLYAAFPAFAIVSINSQGTPLAPKSVGNSAVVVIPANANCFKWTIYSETQALRCNAGTYSQSSGAFTAPTAPTASAGFYIPSDIMINEKALFLSAYSSGPNAASEDEAKVEIDCIAVTGTTNVDTWEELAR
jgi:hypothetical protein